MINTIIISVIGTLVFLYFIWCEIRVRKLKALIIKNKKQIKKQNNKNDFFKKSLNELDENTTTKINDVFNYIDENEASNEKELDKRFDNVYKKINT